MIAGCLNDDIFLEIQRFGASIFVLLFVYSRWRAVCIHGGGRCVCVCVCGVVVTHLVIYFIYLDG